MFEGCFVPVGIWVALGNPMCRYVGQPSESVPENIDNFCGTLFHTKKKRQFINELSFLEKVFLLWGIAKNYNVLGGLHLEV